ncbi:MAG TPA: GAF domain-containing protein [Caldilineales bacterium]|nr:GAF domain-containing protein [Caldilineales bacterium]
MARMDCHGIITTMKRFSLRRDLGVQLLALYILFIGPVLVGALVFDMATRRNLEQDIQESDLSLARAIALETEAILTNAAHTVSNLASLPAVMNADEEGMRVLFRDIKLARRDINLVYRLGTDGIMLYHYPEGPTSTVGVDFSFREYFKRARRSHEPLFSAGRISPTTGKPVATAIMPLWSDDDEFLGVVATNLALAELSDTLTAVIGEQRQEQLISIVDARGQVIAYPGLLDALAGEETLLTVQQREDVGLPSDLLPDWGEWKDDVVSLVVQGKTGATISTAPDGSQWIRSYVSIPVADWGVIVQRPTRAAFATVQRFHRLLMASIAIFVVGGALFWLALSHRVISPIGRLTEFSKRVGSHSSAAARSQVDLAALARREDQMGDLARSLTTMAEDIERRFGELSTLLEISRKVVSSLDVQEVFDSILDEVQRLLDADRSAIVVLDERLGVFRIRASRGLSETYVQQLRIGPSEPYSTAMQALQQGLPVKVVDAETDPEYARFRERARREGFRSLLAAPLLTQHAPPAVLLLYFDQPHDYTENELELVSSFANHAAMAMENAVLFARSDAQLQEQTRRLEAIVESLHDGLILESLTGQVLFCNHRAAELLGIRRALACQRRADELVQRLLSTAERPELAESALHRAILAGRGFVDVTRTGSDGRPQDLRIQVFEVTDARGEVIGRGQFWQDITHDKDLDRMKSALLSTVSHELRTPLAAIKGYASTLLARDVVWDEAAQREFIQTISDEADRLAALVSSLLDLSRLEGGALELQREAYDMAVLAHDVAWREGRRLGVTIRVDAEKNLPLALIDRLRMETVLRNLVDNAAKYSPPDHPVEIAIRRLDGELEVSVRDYGLGVPDDQKGRIFLRFYRGQVERGQRIGGAGLGLAICKGFVEAHGGRIWVEDAHPGARFCFRLPLSPTHTEEMNAYVSTHPGD